MEGHGEVACGCRPSGFIKAIDLFSEYILEDLFLWAPVMVLHLVAAGAGWTYGPYWRGKNHLEFKENTVNWAPREGSVHSPPQPVPKIWQGFRGHLSQPHQKGHISLGHGSLLSVVGPGWLVSQFSSVVKQETGSLGVLRPIA